MKLVDILARELKVWPEDCEAIEQDRRGSCLFKVNGPAIATYVEAVAEDADTAKVTRAQWQAAVDALKSYDDEMAIKKAAHEALVWNGKGLPPVGVFCECRVVSGQEWLKCEIVAHKKHDLSVYAIAFVDENTVMLSGGIRFRPIRTSEQIAAEERSKAIDKMLADAQRPGNHMMSRFHAEDLYDAGYRKFEIVDN